MTIKRSNIHLSKEYLMIAKSYALTIPLLGIHSWDTSAHTQLELSIRNFIVALL